ncbi:MAG: clostripain, partial [Spirochaetia bacterium]|nr:clostripain [Spirochaetia bacterium]
MYYGDADNNLEQALLWDVAEMKEGFVNAQGVNLILLFDRRLMGDSFTKRIFGENFTDTRLYRVTSGKTWRLDGGTEFSEITNHSNYEANMGDALTLKKFIRYCKANFPAEKYALIISNHGGGPKKKSLPAGPEFTPSYKSICQDDTSSDILYTYEISSTLTADESVDLFGIDACLMASVEFAYQFRNDPSNSGFKADIFVASAPETWSDGWDYDTIFSRFDTSVVTAQNFGELIIDVEKTSATMTQMSCFDMSKVQAVKTAVDALAV